MVHPVEVLPNFSLSIFNLTIWSAPCSSARLSPPFNSSKVSRKNKTSTSVCLSRAQNLRKQITINLKPIFCQSTIPADREPRFAVRFFCFFLFLFSVQLPAKLPGDRYSKFAAQHPTAGGVWAASSPWHLAPTLARRTAQGHRYPELCVSNTGWVWCNGGGGVNRGGYKSKSHKHHHHL